MIIHQVKYILDIIAEKGLDFQNVHDAPTQESADLDKASRFPSGYRDYIYKTFHGIDEKAYYLFKYVYESDRRYANELIEHHHDFTEFIPINEGFVNWKN